MMDPMVPPKPASLPQLTIDEQMGLATQLRLDFDIVSCGELALILENTEQTLAGWRCTGEGPAFTKLGKGVFYMRADIDAWIAANRTKPGVKALAA